MFGLAAVLLLIAVPMMLPFPINVPPFKDLVSNSPTIFFLGIFASQFLANALMGVRAKK